MSNNPFKGWGPGDPHPGPCHYSGPDIYNPGVPGPVPSPTFRPPHHHHIHPPRPPRPDNMKYVTKKEFNEVLDNIATATLFEDNSESGTTVAFGNIPAGTKFSNKLSFTEFIKMALYGESTSTGGTTEDENETPITPPPSTDTGEGEDTNEYVTVDQFNSTITKITDSIQQLSLKIDEIAQFINNTSFVTEQSMNTAIADATEDFVTSSNMSSAITEATSDLASKQYVDEKIEEIENSSISYSSLDQINRDSATLLVDAMCTG